MIPKTLLLRNFTLNPGFHRLWSRRCYSTETPTSTEKFDITSAEETPRYIQSATEEEREEIMKKRLKSRLNDNHRRILQGTRPYDENMAWFHLTIRYKQRMLGRFGMDGVDVPVGAVWPTKEEIEDKILWEKTAYPKTIQEYWREIEERKLEKENAIRIREEQITKNIAMVGKWEKDLKAKIAKKEAEVRAARERRARLIEEVRRQFGFAIDPKDERFKQLLEQKEKEDKKLKKEARKKERAAKFLAAMMEKAQAGSIQSSPAETENETEKPVEKLPDRET